PLLPWNTIDTVLLDMDGTLLDLHFDNHFWLEHLPQRYAERHGISRAMADRELQPLFARHAGQLAWYCLDFWSRELDLPIVELKREVAHLISLRPDADVFLDALRRAGKRVALITNAHRDSLSLKLERVALAQHFDRLISSHDSASRRRMRGSGPPCRPISASSGNVPCSSMTACRSCAARAVMASPTGWRCASRTAARAPGTPVNSPRRKITGHCWRDCSRKAATQRRPERHRPPSQVRKRQGPAMRGLVHSLSGCGSAAPASRHGGGCRATGPAAPDWAGVRGACG